ncbi:FMN-binding protein [Methylococcus mesophilus]|uniref:FMN-binding protein n=1 Tax=Methylococcus mesophilus TaxID=2993564 RepID=UPI00224AD737|nr:FMN-binding protein [Methylococcus mesophilus]UZR30027.1 FMN-binding protein [Methylococcus mesophilus]
MHSQSRISGLGRGEKKIASFAGLLMGTLLVGVVPGAGATVYHSQEEAFELAFGVGVSVTAEPVFLTDEQIEAVEREARVKLESGLFTFYTAERDGKSLGFAAIESHTVRTQPESLLIVLSPKGEVVRVEVLAFHEPPEYQPAARWFEQMKGRTIEQLIPGNGIDAVSGATLSSMAALASVRKVKAIFRQAHPAGGE